MSDSPRQLPPKKEVALALLEGPSMFVHLDPRQPGVVVPKWFTGHTQLVLQVGLNMAIPIPNLRVEDEGISCTLSFSRSPFWCRLPWTAVYALVGEDGRGMVWPDDVPPEVALQMQKSTGQGAGQAAGQATGAGGQPGKQAKKGRKLAAVDSADEAPPRPAAKGRARVDGAAGANVKEPKREAPPSRASSESSIEPDEEARPRPQAAPAGSPRKPRRELPPYLRVIK